MARRTKEEAQQTRETILMAALDMFCDKGYSRTTFDEIAKKINLTKGAVYWHFRNKPDIIKALIIEAFERNQAAINREISEVNTLDDLLRYFKYAAQIVKTAPMFRKFLFFVMYQMEWSEGPVNTLNISGPINQIINFHQELIAKVLINSKENGDISRRQTFRPQQKFFMHCGTESFIRPSAKIIPEIFRLWQNKVFSSYSNH